MQDGFWPEAGEAVDRLGAGLLRLGFTSECARESLSTRIKAHLQAKEEEILAVKKILEMFVHFHAVVEGHSGHSRRVPTENQKVFCSQWEARLGVPITLELTQFLWSQQVHFLHRLNQEKSRLERNRKSLETSVRVEVH